MWIARVLVAALLLVGCAARGMAAEADVYAVTCTSSTGFPIFCAVSATNPMPVTGAFSPLPGSLFNVNLTEVGGMPYALGSALSVASAPVVIASDQVAIAVKQATAANLNATVVGTGTFAVQATDNITAWGGATLGAGTAYGTPPTGNVPGVNSFVTNFASFPLITGFATAALQTTGNASLTTIAGNTTNAGTPTLTPGTAGGVSTASAIAPNNTTSVALKASAGQLYDLDGFSISAATPAFIKFYDAAQGSTTCGSGTPKLRYMIPASGAAAGSGFVKDFPNGVPFATAITYCITAAIADNDTTAPAASTYVVNFGYK